MEIRCGKCKKLFRVADEKITGRGIKFSCTQCGNSVKITREDFDAYTLSKSAVSALDMFEPKTKPGATPLIEPAEAKAAENAPSSSSIPDLLQEKEEHIFSEPKPSEELFVGNAPRPEKAALKEVAMATTIPDTLRPEQVTGGPIEPEEKKKPDYYAVADMEAKTQLTTSSLTAQSQEQEHKMTPALDFTTLPKQEPKSYPEPAESATPPHEPDSPPPIHTTLAATRTSPDAIPAMPIEEAADTVMEQIGHESPQKKSSHTGRMVLVLMSAILLLGVAGFGAYKFMLPSMQKAKRPAQDMTSIEGLRIVNPSGSIEPSGDLLITGSVENVSDKEQSAWYIVADVYDAQGNVLNKIRLLSGKQIYSRADYDVLLKRGVNVAELKAKILQSQNIVIPAKGSVAFEMRYIQPPIGIASFNAVLQPYEPSRLLKEIAEETK